MGLISRVLAAKLGTTMMDRALRDRRASAPSAGEYIPANQVGTRAGGALNGLAGRATQIYRDNPKLVGGIATLAAAALLVSLKQGRGSFRR